jgi:asparagine synthase (glutamine-hydrolysing)
LNKHVPQQITNRTKMGFDVPIANWLRDELRDWAENLLDETRLNNEGFLNVKYVREHWQQHLSGKRNRQHSLWAVLMFQSWLNRWN